MDSLWRIMKLFLIIILSPVLFVIGNLLFLVLVFEEHPVLKAIGMLGGLNFEVQHIF